MNFPKILGLGSLTNSFPTSARLRASVPAELNVESVLLLNCIAGCVRIDMYENEGGLWTLQVIATEFDGLIVSVYCRVDQKNIFPGKRKVVRPSPYRPYRLLQP